ncbi:uncharacterized protein LOC135141244 [Zophobas morio]|uniref:uncharacterized protein LOC135141244 n=1 Tax=Zophobas morio TaxID=2755281 RepID=UPI0030839FB6
MGTTQSSLNEENPQSTKIKNLKEIRFHVQDQEHVVKTEDIDPNTSLNFYLRNHLHLTGTKVMCREGGCGSCVVVLQNKDPVTQKKIFLAVNSCLVPILSCNGWKIYTVEGIGDPLVGYHPVQKVLANFNGTQCGFCSPGMVMNMYALYESGKLTMQDVENSFGGNICRCTGYRPILTAFKSLCKDANPELLGQYPDIEDLVVCQREKCEWECVEQSDKSDKVPTYTLFEDTSKWIKVHTLKDLLKTMQSYTKLTYRLVAGNTAQGVYQAYANPVDLYIDVTSIPELTLYEFKGDSLVLGANITLSNTIEVFQNIAKTYPNFSYLNQMADHIDLIANVPVRNRATLAGNLMIKHDHNEFPSDVFLLLETVGALLTVVSVDGTQTIQRPSDFIKNEMKLKILLKVILPEYSNLVKLVSYKIMPRAQNVHAIVNAGFLFQFHPSYVLDKATIVYGNINPAFIHASSTETILQGANLFDNHTLQTVYANLSHELEADVRPPDPSPLCRQQLAISLFYKAVLFLAPDHLLSPRHLSGGPVLQRPISKGTQDYESNKSLYPLTKPIPKLEALAQTSGQAEYIEDMPDLHNQLHGALVLAHAPPNSKIIRIDTKKALEMEGIVAFFSKADIPGDNNFTPLGLSYINAKEEIFCSGRVMYYEQPIGILVGYREDVVQYAINLIELIYDESNVEPMLSTRQILKSGRTDRVIHVRTVQPKRKGNDVQHVLKGTFDIYQQYHFHMELQCCNVIPTEDGLNVYPSSQWMDLTQVAIANMLKIPNNKINVTIRRCGGAFGAKITRNGLVACAAALASWKLRKPVKLSLPLKTNMAAIGKRFPLSTDYEVGVNNSGIIQYLNCRHYTDVGAQRNEDISNEVVNFFSASYVPDTFTIDVNKTITDTPTNTFARAPGTLEGLAAIESIIEHIAISLNVDPIELRLRNLRTDTPLAKYVNELRTWANVDTRKQEITDFNKENRWKKKGIAAVPMAYELAIGGPYAAMVSIFHGDGSVQISHGGVEIGQGINTKVIQVCAYKLGIPMEKVSVVPSSSFVAANSTQTGSSITSEAVCYGTIQACDQLLARIKPVRDRLGNPTWEQLIQKCFEEFIDLTARGQYSPNEPNVQTYQVYGVCAAEVLLDVLTGQYLVTRVDLIEDTGESMSPEIDIGQVEGAFVMGMGYYTTEQIVYNYEGKLLTNNTWTYHPPGARDIPINFNVKFPKNNPNPVGVLKSKATGEPAVCLAVAVPLAIRHAVASARADAGTSDLWYPIDGPTTVENVFLNCLNDHTHYTL